MRAMVARRPKEDLMLEERAMPTPDKGQVLIRVLACAVCRTDLHVRDGEIEGIRYPVIPGHQVVGVIEKLGEGVSGFSVGQKVGVPWLGLSCGVCRYCKEGKENLCDDARFTGCHIDGGFAEYMVANQSFIFPIPIGYSEVQASPLLCGGLIGYRALRMTGDARRLGFYGFGSSAHILTQLARWQGKEVYAFTRKGDKESQRFALSLGAAGAFDSDQLPPVLLDAAIIFAPVGALVPMALRAVRKGGVVVCAGIHMDDIPSFPYSILWGERIVRSVANLTRMDGEEFLAIAPQVPIKTEVNLYTLESANQALKDLEDGRIQGTAVLKIEDF